MGIGEVHAENRERKLLLYAKYLIVHQRRRNILQDRRGEDSGPPQGWRDRRATAERRLPLVQEDALTEAEWFRLMVRFIHSKKK